MSTNILYAKVILPLKLNKPITYSIPEEYMNIIEVGSIIRVQLVNKEYNAVIKELSPISDYNPKKIKPILEFSGKKVRTSEMFFWEKLAEYYMCTIGEVYKAAYPNTLTDNSEIKNKLQKKIVPKSLSQDRPNISPSKISTEVEGIHMISSASQKINPLTPSQVQAFSEINKAHSKSKVVLLNGVTGSGKTEVYIHLIQKTLEEGKNVLYLLPEIALCRQIADRLSKIWGDRLNVYHSKQSISKRKHIIKSISQEEGGENTNTSNNPQVILGLRSAVFLPYQNLGLIIVDEEHDSSYKQASPTPRYNGRDTAIILSTILKSKVVLGSATPSFESLLNVSKGKYSEVRLSSKFHLSPPPEVILIDMVKERKKRATNGGFSKILLREIENTTNAGEQALIFRSRRAYSPYVQCAACGNIPKCKRCNLHLTYHKFNNSLSCHHCGYKIGTGSASSQWKCHICQEVAVTPLGRGTERLAEELSLLFPEKTIARYDADSIKTKGEADRILKDFSKGKIDILIGTQMITKGFDFENLSLVGIIQAESLLAVDDFRGDEKGVQLLTQLLGRSGRRKKTGKMLIQTMLADHPVFDLFLRDFNLNNLLSERELFNYPPYSRLINISLRDKYQSRLIKNGEVVRKLILKAGIDEFYGPIVPPIEKTNCEYILFFNIHLKNNKSLSALKRKLYTELSNFEGLINIDVDPI